MQTTERDLLREAIRKALSHRAGDAPSARVVVGVTWDHVAAQLAPVIGQRGVDALLGRALHLTSKTFPWPFMAEGRGRVAEPLATFLARLEAREASATAEASRALLMTFTDLLGNLIGAPLSERLLAPVWASLPRAPRQQEAS